MDISCKTTTFHQPKNPSFERCGLIIDRKSLSGTNIISRAILFRVYVVSYILDPLYKKGVGWMLRRGGGGASSKELNLCARCRAGRI